MEKRRLDWRRRVCYQRGMPIYPYNKTLPRIDRTAFVAPSADVIGDVVVGAHTGIWYQVVIRGDVNHIRIGANTNIQDGTVIHVASEKMGNIPTLIGDNVTVGHQALLHACTVGNNAFIGMKSIIMDGAVVEDNAMVAAGALVPPRKRIPSGELWAGSPAKFMRRLTPEDLQNIQWSADHYAELAKRYF